jgi:hypothetical protein
VDSRLIHVCHADSCTRAIAVATAQPLRTQCFDDEYPD